MSNVRTPAAGLTVVFAAVAACAVAPQSHDRVRTSIEEIHMTQHASGPFQVKLTPQSLALDDDTGGAARARLSIDKQFHGDLEAASRGEMLSAAGSVKGSAGYVAIEKVTGTLAGRKGSFVLQHNATMTRGVPYLNIIVVPDSADGELTGLTGTMKIIIAPDGAHSYEFEYALPGV